MATDCNDDGLDRELPDLDGMPPELTAADPNLSQLVTRPNVKYDPTIQHDVDVHTAITSGLASYLMTLDGAYAGKSTRLASVVYDWADRDDGSRPLPSAAVHSEETGKYDPSSGLAPGKPTTVAAQGPAQVTISAIYALDELSVEVYCADKVQRAGVRRMLEDAFWPVEWMAGFRLMLPQYHGAIATFLPLTAQLGDSSEVAITGLRPLTFRLRARCPVYRVHRLALAKPRVVGDVTI